MDPQGVIRPSTHIQHQPRIIRPSLSALLLQSLRGKAPFSELPEEDLLSIVKVAFWLEAFPSELYLPSQPLYPLHSSLPFFLSLPAHPLLSPPSRFPLHFFYLPSLPCWLSHPPIPPLSSVRQDALPQAMPLAEFSVGSDILTEGSSADKAFLMARGQILVLVGGKEASSAPFPPPQIAAANSPLTPILDSLALIAAGGPVEARPGLRRASPAV